MKLNFSRRDLFVEDGAGNQANRIDFFLLLFAAAYFTAVSFSVKGKETVGWFWHFENFENCAIDEKTVSWSLNGCLSVLRVRLT